MPHGLIYIPNADLNSAWADSDYTKLIVQDGNKVLGDASIEQQFQLLASGSTGGGTGLKFLLSVYAHGHAGDGILDVKVENGPGPTWTSIEMCHFTLTPTLFTLDFGALNPGSTIAVSLYPSVNVQIDWINGVFIYENWLIDAFPPRSLNPQIVPRPRVLRAVPNDRPRFVRALYADAPPPPDRTELLALLQYRKTIRPQRGQPHGPPQRRPCVAYLFDADPHSPPATFPPARRIDDARREQERYTDPRRRLQDRLAFLWPRKSSSLLGAILPRRRWLKSREYIRPHRGQRQRRLPIAVWYEEPFHSTPVGSGAPYLGGMSIASLKWISAHALKVEFESTYGTSYQYQLYAGRRPIGRTRSVSDRVIIGQGKPSDSPEHILLLAVDPAQVDTDYGARLPQRPYNRVRVEFTGRDHPDVKLYEVTAGNGAGEAVDPANIVGRALHDRGRTYEIVTDPLPECGSWNLSLAARDNRLPSGNLGTAQAFTAEVLTYPPDVARDRDGNRFDLAIAEGVLTVSI